MSLSLLRPLLRLFAALLAVAAAPATAAPAIVYGVNGHDGRPAYPLSRSEAVFRLLDQRNLRSYRFDVDPRNFAVLDRLVQLSRQYNIALRPMVYPMSREIGYALARRYANDIKVWEIGNEQDLDRAAAPARIAAMTTMYRGMKQASDELGAGLQFTINITACNSDDHSASARCPGDRNGSLWFLDQAKAAGFDFDRISFHYYAFHGERGYWMDLYLGQLRAAAQKYGTKCTSTSSTAPRSTRATPMAAIPATAPATTAWRTCCRRCAATMPTWSPRSISTNCSTSRTSRARRRISA